MYLGTIIEINEDGVQVSFKDDFAGVWPKELFLNTKIPLKIGEEFFLKEVEKGDFGTIENPKAELGEGWHCSMVNENIRRKYLRSREKDSVTPIEDHETKLIIFTIHRIVDAKTQKAIIKGKC